MSIIYTEKTERGRVAVSEGAVAELVLAVIRKYDKNIYITNDKGKRTSKVYKTMGGSSAGNIQVIEGSRGIELKIYMILSFGKSIKKVTDDLMENIREAIEIAIGQNPRRITIVITGTKSRKTVRRNIEVRREYDV